MGERSVIQSVQALRGFAALLVAFTHSLTFARGPDSGLPYLVFGGAGVDIFFVISGFIIYASQAGRPPLEFARRRFVRVVPLYWIYTGFWALVLAAVGSAPETGHLVKSLLFIPHESPTYAGEIWPLLPPGWTLCYEVFFYALFGAVLFVAPRHLLAVLTGTLLTLAAVGFVFVPTDPILRTYTGALLLEFLAGVLIAAVAERIPFRAVWLIPAGIAAIAVSDLYEASQLVEWGIPAALIVAGAVGARDASVPRPLLFLGDASYSIYLTHFITLKLTGALFGADWPGVAARFVLAVLVGSLCYVAIERPLLAALRRKRSSSVVAYP